MSPERRTTLLRLVSLFVVVAVVITIYLLRDRIQNLANYGYLGILIVTALSNATIFLPVPGIAFVFGMGAVFNPFVVAIFAGVGAAIGELSGYLLGFSGQGLAERSERYDRLLVWMRSHSRTTDWIILGFAIIPNPFFDLAGVAAGTLKIPIWRFMIFVTAGSIIKMLFFALIGQTGLNWLSEFFGRL